MSPSKRFVPSLSSVENRKDKLNEQCGERGCMIASCHKSVPAYAAVAGATTQREHYSDHDKESGRWLTFPSIHPPPTNDWCGRSLVKGHNDNAPNNAPKVVSIKFLHGDSNYNQYGFFTRKNYMDLYDIC